MTLFDGILLFVGGSWGILNMIILFRFAGDPKVRILPMFFIPYALLLFLAYRLWG